MTDLLSELRCITDALDVARVDYALCGGVALAIYGIPRATIDIDMLVTPDGVKVDMSAQAVTVRLQRVSQLRALCLSLAAAGRRAGLAPHPAGQQATIGARGRGNGGDEQASGAAPTGGGQAEP